MPQKKKKEGMRKSYMKFMLFSLNVDNITLNRDEQRCMFVIRELGNIHQGVPSRFANLKSVIKVGFHTARTTLTPQLLTIFWAPNLIHLTPKKCSF